MWLGLGLRLTRAPTKYEPWQASSIGELKSFAYLKDHGARWVRHNRCHLTRCFPKATRVDSSNAPLTLTLTLTFTLTLTLTLTLILTLTHLAVGDDGH